MHGFHALGRIEETSAPPLSHGQADLGPEEGVWRRRTAITDGLARPAETGTIDGWLRHVDYGDDVGERKRNWRLAVVLAMTLPGLAGTAAEVEPSDLIEYANVQGTALHAHVFAAEVGEPAAPRHPVLLRRRLVIGNASTVLSVCCTARQGGIRRDSRWNTASVNATAAASPTAWRTRSRLSDGRRLTPTTWASTRRASW